LSFIILLAVIVIFVAVCEARCCASASTLSTEMGDLDELRETAGEDGLACVAGTLP
jgi:hypothetical protein